MSESKEFREKNRAKPPQSAHFVTFAPLPPKSTEFIEKRKNLIDFLL